MRLNDNFGLNSNGYPTQQMPFSYDAIAVEFAPFDLRIEQQLPSFVDGHEGSVFFVIDNFTNMLNDDWGMLYQLGFPQYQEVVEATANDQG